MQENICSIPINDVFMPRDGCPMCRMRDMLERRKAEYVTGSAMMEPNVRVRTNEEGFCYRHFSMMIKLGKRLSNALILESHLEKVMEELPLTNPRGKFDKKRLEKLDSMSKDCFICRDIKYNMENMVRIVHAMWVNEPEFRQLYDEQPYICLEHYIMLLGVDQKGLGKNFDAFYQATFVLALEYLMELKDDVHHFSAMFDYRNEGAEWGNSRDSIERAVEFVEFLTGEKIIAEDVEE